MDFLLKSRDIFLLVLGNFQLCIISEKRWNNKSFFGFDLCRPETLECHFSSILFVRKKTYIKVLYLHNVTTRKYQTIWENVKKLQLFGRKSRKCKCPLGWNNKNRQNNKQFLSTFLLKQSIVFNFLSRFRHQVKLFWQSRFPPIKLFYNIDH